MSDLRTLTQEQLLHLVDRAQRGVSSRRMCEQHHTPPVTGCPYPQCIAARKATETTEV